MPEGLPREDSGWTLTATDALARQLREEENLLQSRSGAPVWEAPRITSLSRWCIDQWSGSWPAEQLLSSTQELILWRQAIERDALGLLAPQSAANEARRTDQILRRFRIDDVGAIWTDEHRAFRRWRQWVQAQLDANGWITAADVPRMAREQFAAGRITAPWRLQLRGFFSPFSPAENALLETLEAAGSRVEQISPPTIANKVRCLDFESVELQLRHVAITVRDALRAAADAPPSILIALPAVEERRLALESVLRELVAPWVADGTGPAPWRWLQGQALAEQPWVSLLLDILQLGPEQNDLARLSRVLLSPVLFDPAARLQSSQADEWLRERGAPRIRLESLCRRLQGAVRERFDALMQALSGAPHRALPSTWSTHFLECLQAMGWPGHRALDSDAYQAVRAGRELLDRLASLDTQLGEVPVSTARMWLQELARAPFSPRADHLQPVRIASFQEAASLRADLVFVLDADSAHIPSPVRPLSFVPAETLRSAGVPEAAPETWLEHSRCLARHLLAHCAPEVSVCVSGVDERGAEVLPSPLFATGHDWESRTVAERVSALELALPDQGSHACLSVEDPVSPVGEAELRSLRAGVALFDAWFEAPFFAFCRDRLGIRELPVPQTGIPSQAQGQVLHQVLHDFFERVPDQASLCAQDAELIQGLIDELLDRHVPQYLPEMDYGTMLVALERGRMRGVLLEWLAHECRRVDAFEVIARECVARPNIAGLQLSLRIDRIDRVHTPHGERCLVIDYKTGRNADPKGWKAERAAQLPLYASHAAREVAGIERVNGVCFAHLKEGHPTLSAFTDWRKRLLEEPAKDLSDNWQQHLTQWHADIDAAARGFLSGNAGLPARIDAHSFNAALYQLINAPVNEDEA